MAWPTRSRIVGAFRQATAANTKYYGAAVPAGKTHLVNTIALYNGSAAATTFYVWLKHAGVEYPVFQWVGLAVEGVYTVFGLRIIAEAGDQLGFSTTAAKTLVAATFHGAEL